MLSEGESYQRVQERFIFELFSLFTRVCLKEEKNYTYLVILNPYPFFAIISLNRVNYLVKTLRSRKLEEFKDSVNYTTWTAAGTFCGKKLA